MTRAPVPHTCPKINEVISAINSVDWPVDNWWSKESLIEMMEELRFSNDALRTWGKDLNKEVEELKDEIFDLRKKIKLLEK